MEESLALAREMGDRSVISGALGGLGQLAADQGDYARALSLQKESLEQYRQAGHFREISKNLADIALAVGALGWYVVARYLGLLVGGTPVAGLSPNMDSSCGGAL